MCHRRSTRHQPLVILLLLSALSASAALAQPNDCGWAAGFHVRDFGGSVFDFLVWDDGSGPALYAAGRFETADGAKAKAVARWDGYHWWPLLGSGGAGLDANFNDLAVRALAVWDDGSGPALYAGGEILTADGKTVNHVAKWDGADWWPLEGPSGVGTNRPVAALVGFGDGLYAAGEFRKAGGVTANYVAKWDGAGWSALTGSAGEGLGEEAFALEAWDDGSGPALYVGGRFEEAGGVESLGAARWDGADWQSLGDEDSGLDGSVYSFLPYGSRLAASGDFDSGGGARRVALWDGTAWTGLSAQELDGDIWALETWDGQLYAAGESIEVDGVEAGGLIRWDGAAWHPVTEPSGAMIRYSAYALAGFDDGDDDVLWIGGSFEELGDHIVGGAGHWDGTELLPMPSRAGGMDGQVEDFVIWDDGTGPAFYAVGFFDFAGAEGGRSISRWDGRRWSPLPSVPQGDVSEIEVFDGELYIGGSFTSIDGVVMNRVARFDGASWSPLSGAAGTGANGSVFEMIVWDDGAGEALFLGGSFTEAGGLAANRIARWDGSDFSALGSGLDQPPVSFVTWDDGAGEALFAGGRFVTAGGLTAHHVARWDGAAWSALTGAAGTGVSDDVGGLAVWNGDLYAGGRFANAGGVTVNRVARWDGAEWSALVDGEGLVGLGGARVTEMTTFDSKLLIATSGQGGGSGAAVDRVAAWDGSGWQDYAQPVAGPDRSVFELESFDLGAGSFLVAGGPFDEAGGGLSGGIAFWSCDGAAPSSPIRLESTSHTAGELTPTSQITAEWQGASDAGPLGLWGYSWVFDRLADTVPDDRVEHLDADGPLSASSKELADGFGYYFHLKSCDRHLNCTVSHIGPFHIGDPAALLFFDGFESGDLAAWSEAIGE